MRQIVKQNNLTSFLQSGGGSLSSGFKLHNSVVNLKLKTSKYLNGFQTKTQSGGSIRSNSEVRTYNGGQSGGLIRSGTEIRPVTSTHKGGSRKHRVNKQKTRRTNGKKKSHYKKRKSNKK